jgi:hypothetical protein
MKNALAFLAIVIIGGGITAGIDILLGINFKDVGDVAHVIHKVTYIVWGGILLAVMDKMFQ